MIKRSRLIAVGLLTLFLGLLIFFPARVAYQWFAPPEVSLAGISGSIWRGNAREATAGGIYLTDLSWTMQPAQIFRGQMAYAFAATPVNGFIEGQVGLGMGGTATFSDLTAALSLQSLQAVIGDAGIRGSVNIQFERLLLSGGIPIAADGVVEVANLIAPKVHQASIGGYRAEFFTQESGVMASVEDTDGVIDLAGSLQLANDRNYQFIAQLAPKSNTPASLRQQMQFLGSADERGQHTLRLEGQL